LQFHLPHFSSSRGSLLALMVALTLSEYGYTNKEPCKKVATSNHVQQVKEGTNWQALVELTWSSTSDIPRWLIIGKTVPPWLDYSESTPKSWPIAQPGKDGEDEKNGKSDHCNFPSTKKAESPSICSPYSSLQIFLVNQKLKVPSCQLWSVEMLLWVWYGLSRYTKKQSIVWMETARDRTPWNSSKFSQRQSYDGTKTL
jgi:hypothetical protein